MVSSMFNTVSGKKIAIFGFAFSPQGCPSFVLDSPFSAALSNSRGTVAVYDRHHRFCYQSNAGHPYLCHIEACRSNCLLSLSLPSQDILNLVYICECNGLHEVAAYWKQVHAVLSLQGSLMYQVGLVKGQRFRFLFYAGKLGLLFSFD